MTKDQILDFFARFDGPEGCSTRSICLLKSLSPEMRNVEGSFSWQCPGDRSKHLSRAILRNMGIPAKEQDYFLSFLETYEGSCECEILSNLLAEKDGVKGFASDYLGK
jgi:hypothetical protein